MSVLDSTGAYLREGDRVRVGQKTGVFRRFEPLFPKTYVQNEYDGDVVVEFDDKEEWFPAFVSGADDACYDVERFAALPQSQVSRSS